MTATAWACPGAEEEPVRYAIVSDLHANLQAWRAVLRDIAGQGAERVICLGDVVGYGPNPAEVLESVHGAVHHFVLGNHDAMLCGMLDPGLFNDAALRVIEWTRTQLAPDAVRLMKTWPLVLRARGFRCAHGDFGFPGRFLYIDEPADAIPSWQSVDEPLLFVGHTHQPSLHLLGSSGRPHKADPQDFALEPGRRHIVNVGSVGQPRDGGIEASYVLYDADRGAVYFRRVPFDLDAYREAVRAAGLPDAGGWFLGQDPLKGRRPLRDQLSFRPPQNAHEEVRGAVAEQELTVLRSRVKRWRAATAGLAAMLCAGAAASGWAWHRYATRGLEIRAAWTTPTRAADRPAGANLLAAPAAGAPNQAVQGWIVGLGDRRRQTVRAVDGGDDAAFVLESATARDEVRVASVPVEIEPGQKFAVEGIFDRGADFRGTVALAVAVVRRAGTREETVENFVVKEPNLRRKEGSLGARETFEAPAGALRASVRVAGRFTGTVRVTGLSLQRKGD